MKTSEPVTEKKLAGRGETTPASRTAAATSASCPVVIRFYGTMKPNRVYPLTVQISSKGKAAVAPPDTPPLVVRPIIPGAVVTPLEQKLDPTRKGNEVVFQVISLAKGPYRGARVEVYAPGQDVQTIRVGMRAKTQRMTWVLLALTIGVTWALLYFCKYYPLHGRVGRDPLFGGDYLKAKFVEAVGEFIPLNSDLVKQPVETVGDGLKYAYDYLIVTSGDSRNIPLIGLVLLGLTVFSWASHRSQRSRRKANLVLPQPGAGMEAMETMPLSTRPQPITVEPI
jgi:hypothetical protein